MESKFLAHRQLGRIFQFYEMRREEAAVPVRFAELASLHDARLLAHSGVTCCANPSAAVALMTGPTSVSSMDGSPMSSSSIAPLIISSTESAISSCKNNKRSAEHR